MCYEYIIFDSAAVVPLLLELRPIASVEHTISLGFPVFRRDKLLCDLFCVGWNIIAVDDLRSAKHVSNGIPQHKLHYLYS